MSARGRARFWLPGLLALCLALGACGKSTPGSATAPPAAAIAPLARQGALSVVTRNTTRLGGADVAADAAAVARAVYPGLTPSSRPAAVVLVNERDWPAALTASVLSGAPVGAPVLFTEGSKVPEVTREALETLHPKGLAALGGAQVIRIGTRANLPAGLVASTLPVAPNAPQTAEDLADLLRRLTGVTPTSVILLPTSAPRAIAMPAAGLAAESGAPILMVEPAHVPHQTLHVLGGLHGPSLFLLDPSAIAPAASRILRRFGHFMSIAPSLGEGVGPAANAIAIARFTNGTFGWGVKEPGHGLVFANASRPLDAPAAALLSASAEYGPLLLLESATAIPSELQSYLGDIQPAYTNQPAYRPVRGVYNHGWLIGDEHAISAVTQAELDSLLEITPSSQNGEEASREQT